MKVKRYQFAFVAFFLLFQAKWSFAVVADANIVEAVRLSKFYKLKVLNQECNDIRQEHFKCQRTPVSRDRSLAKNNKSDTVQNQRKGHRIPQTMFINQTAKIEKIRELERQLERSQLNLKLVETNDLSQLIPAFDSHFYIGEFGNVLDRQGFKIITIIDDDDSLVEFRTSTMVFQDNPGPRESQHLVGVRNGQYIPIIDIEIVWFHGISTEGLVSGSSIRTPPFLIITGTQDYENLMGAKQTVYVFEHLVIDPNDL